MLQSCETIQRGLAKSRQNLIYYRCETIHIQTYTPLFDREKFLPSPLLSIKDKENALAIMPGRFLLYGIDGRRRQ